MLGWDDLKKTIQVTKTEVECPVLDCTETVRRCRRGERLRSPDFCCPRHGIFVSPTTFEYPDVADNLLWRSPEDLALWKKINSPGVKRECRVARDNSEDGLTWAVFRYFEHQGELGRFVDLAAKERVALNVRILYWSYCPATAGPWKPLVDAAGMFGEAYARRSEPDLIIDDERILVFVESKFLSGNRTKPSVPEDPKRYLSGGDHWFARVFASDPNFQRVAVEEQLYELMRLWLLGSWIAAQSGRQFLLVNILRSAAKRERDIVTRFGRQARYGSQRSFARLTWEQIYSELIRPANGTEEADGLTHYLVNKTANYQVSEARQEGVLRRAFDLPA